MDPSGDMRIVNLINPPALELYDPNAYPQLGLLYLGGALRRAGFHCRFVDLADKETYTVPDADYHLISVLHATYKSALGVRNSIQDGMVVVGGAQATIDPIQTYEDFHPDALVTGEADTEIANVLSNGARGIIGGGVIKNLDSLAFPDRDLVPIEKLRNVSGVNMDRYTGDGATTTMISSRGCPFRCNFCCKVPQNEYFRWRSPRNIVDEMFELREKYDINQVRFYDDCFTVNPKRVYDFCSLLKGKGFYWSCMTRADAIPDRMAREMYSSGCRDVQIGIESGSQKILNDMNKKTNVETNKKAIETIKNAGMKARIFLMELYPTETAEDTELTKKFVTDTQPDGVTLSSFLPLPGSSLYEKYRNDPRYSGRTYYNLERDSDLKTWIKSEVWRKQ